MDVKGEETTLKWLRTETNGGGGELLCSWKGALGLHQKPGYFRPHKYLLHSLFVATVLLTYLFIYLPI
jgi:hypothetical protein